MGFAIRHTRPSEAELARLADGSLPAAKRLELRARVDASPELTQALTDQEQVVSMLRSVDEPAPTSLRTRIEAMTAASSTRSPPPRRIMLSAATALTVVVAAIVAVSQVGTSLPSVSQTAQLALAPAMTAPPPEAPGHNGSLAVAVDRVSFPYWGARFGWRAVGTRADVLNARRIVTVYYANPAGARVGYSIVAGTALANPDGRMLTRHGVRFSLVHDRSLQVITWLRSGHTCVLSSRGISEQALLRLASGDAQQSPST
jgi:hypothetical protein